MKKIICMLMSVVMLATMIPCLSLTTEAAGDSIATATPVYFGDTYYGSITDWNEKDMYQFTLNSSGKVGINLTAYIYATHYYLYDANGNEIWSSCWQYWNDNTQMYRKNDILYLTKGTYYFAVVRYNGTGEYNFNLTFSSSKESFTDLQGGSNNSIATADVLALDTVYRGQLAINDERDLYKFTLPTSGRVTLALSAYIYATHYYLYDANGNEIWSSCWQYWNDNTQVLTKKDALDLTKGTYYFAVVRYNGTGNYNFKLSYNSAKESYTDLQGGSNNALIEADKINLNTLYKGQIAINDDRDLYKFTVSKASTIRLALKAYIPSTHYYLYDADGNEIWNRRWMYWNDTSKYLLLSEEWTLNAGTYYFAVARYDGTGPYNFEIQCGHKWTTASVVKATQLAAGKVTKRCSICNATTTVTTPKIASVKLYTTAYTYDGKVKTPSVTVKDTNGRVLTKGTDYTVTYASGRKLTGKYQVTINFKGKYGGKRITYFNILPSKTTSLTATSATTRLQAKWKKVTGASAYRVQLRSASSTLLKTVYTTGTSYTFTGLSAATNYKVVVTAYKMIDGKKTYSKFYTTLLTGTSPAVPTLTARAGAKKATLSWKKMTRASGYMIYMSTSKNGTYTAIKAVTSGSTLSYTKYGLTKGKTYYFKIRSFKVVNGKRIYSSFSTVKSVKVV